MRSCNSCNRNPCACNEVPLPYYEDPCFQENQTQGCKIFNQYSPVLRISTGWAVPEENEVVTLKVAALADMLIGSVIWNPEFGDYVVISYDQAGQMIKVVKNLGNDTPVGTVIPSCTKFILNKLTQEYFLQFQIDEIKVILSTMQDDITDLQVDVVNVENDVDNIEIILANLNTFEDFTPNPVAVGGGGGVLDNILVDIAQFSTYGDIVYITIAVYAEMITNTADYIEFDLPFEAYDISVGTYDMAGSLQNGAVIDNGSFRVQNGFATCRVYKSDLSTLTVSAQANFSANFFYKKAPST